MRFLPAAVLLLAPLTTQAQFPPPGQYTGGAKQAGGTGGGPGTMTLSVAIEGDSTVIAMYTDPEQPFPISNQGVLDQSWTIVLEVIPGGLHCRFIALSDKWEAYCEDQFNQPQFEVWFDRTPIPMKEIP
jgi:hypothetical protein